ncbi:027d77a6-6148-466e-a3e2-4ab4bd6a52a1-CDS [Sclerotinia trifoliorum]|uniref:027d77a6-6148-466e-a3e2-4ab4bd6a52a1-CDS n=1 Tax=Sclerotinia trifoliorum TaxID=28548 RepID=A0A8H2VZQ2_9HELO|nr:027d77a6-6148-466e-a3e2-4ab4bd6a52a1-CDS [Sclerotinia trifoliorum]
MVAQVVHVNLNLTDFRANLFSVKHFVYGKGISNFWHCSFPTIPTIVKTLSILIRLNQCRSWRRHRPLKRLKESGSMPTSPLSIVSKMIFIMGSRKIDSIFTSHNLLNWKSSSLSLRRLLPSTLSVQVCYLMITFNFTANLQRSASGFLQSCWTKYHNGLMDIVNPGHHMKRRVICNGHLLKDRDVWLNGIEKVMIQTLWMKYEYG